MVWSRVFFVEIVTKIYILLTKCASASRIYRVLCQDAQGLFKLFSKNRSFYLGNVVQVVSSSGLAYIYISWCAHVLKIIMCTRNKIYILNVRIDPESAFSKTAGGIFVWCVFTMVAWCDRNHRMQKYTHAPCILPILIPF